MAYGRVASSIVLWYKSAYTTVSCKEIRIKAIKSVYPVIDTHQGYIPSDSDNDKAAKNINWANRLTFIIPFTLTHIMCLGVFFVKFSYAAVLVCFLSYAVRGIAITAFYHRFLSHRAFKTSRFMQFIFALLGATAAQGGPLWWSNHHRHHHQFADTPKDKHSPLNDGFWWSHCGWFLLGDNYKTKTDNIKDLASFPELVILDKYDALIPVLYATALYMIGGWQYLIWGYFVATILIYHITFCVNSISHMFGKRPFNTKDNSRNNWWLALLTFGEGWHNNHHFWPSSARQGFKIHQIDFSFYVLKLLEKCGLIWDLRTPPKEVMDA